MLQAVLCVLKFLKNQATKMLLVKYLKTILVYPFQWTWMKPLVLCKGCTMVCLVEGKEKGRK
jgi:hypothetical protein